MRATGLAAILLGVLVMLFPYYEEWVPVLALSARDSMLIGALLIVVGGLCVALDRR